MLKIKDNMCFHNPGRRESRNPKVDELWESATWTSEYLGTEWLGSSLYSELLLWDIQIDVKVTAT